MALFGFDRLSVVRELQRLLFDTRPQMKKILRTFQQGRRIFMKELTTIVGHVGGRCKGELEEQSTWSEAPAGSAEVKAKIHEHVGSLFALVDRDGDARRFDEVERRIIPLVLTLGRLFLTYFLVRREEASAKEVDAWVKRGYRRRRQERKYLSTYFGRVCFWRRYVRRPGGAGVHPLDLALGLTVDGFSLLVTEICARLSTLISYEQVTALSLYFLGWSPSKTSVEKAVLGLGRYSEKWFEAAPPPEGDGEVMVIQLDSKATPTATDEELEKRRGKREQKKPALSPRHRGREKRARRNKKRRLKGDKSKNGKATTIVTMYTLKKSRDENGKPVLLGPINKWVYSSYAPKRHAFAIARREADKRGFSDGSGKLVQIVTDGDEDLERYAKELFPKAKHTLDIMHVLEYVWEAGRFVYKEGSHELTAWVKMQERLLYRGKAVLVRQHIGDLLKAAPPAAAERLEGIREYFRKRLRLMNYAEMRKLDLEVASGVVEGAVRHVVAKRFDSGSMRWIKERAEALLQLRCIEINGDWSAFIAFVDTKLRAESKAAASPVRLLTNTPGALPTLGVAA